MQTPSSTWSERTESALGLSPTHRGEGSIRRGVSTPFYSEVSPADIAGAVEKGMREKGPRAMRRTGTSWVSPASKVVVQTPMIASPRKNGTAVTMIVPDGPFARWMSEVDRAVATIVGGGDKQPLSCLSPRDPDGFVATLRASPSGIVVTRRVDTMRGTTIIESATEGDMEASEKATTVVRMMGAEVGPGKVAVRWMLMSAQLEPPPIDFSTLHTRLYDDDCDTVAFVSSDSEEEEDDDVSVGSTVEAAATESPETGDARESYPAASEDHDADRPFQGDLRLESFCSSPTTSPLALPTEDRSGRDAEGLPENPPDLPTEERAGHIDDRPCERRTPIEPAEPELSQ